MPYIRDVRNEIESLIKNIKNQKSFTQENINSIKDDIALLDKEMDSLFNQLWALSASGKSAKDAAEHLNLYAGIPALQWLEDINSTVNTIKTRLSEFDPHELEKEKLSLEIDLNRYELLSKHLQSQIDSLEESMLHNRLLQMAAPAIEELNITEEEFQSADKYGFFDIVLNTRNAKLKDLVSQWKLLTDKPMISSYHKDKEARNEHVLKKDQYNETIKTLNSIEQAINLNAEQIQGRDKLVKRLEGFNSDEKIKAAIFVKFKKLINDPTVIQVFAEKTDNQKLLSDYSLANAKRHFLMMSLDSFNTELANLNSLYTFFDKKYRELNKLSRSYDLKKMDFDYYFKEKLNSIIERSKVKQTWLDKNKDFVMSYIYQNNNDTDLTWSIIYYSMLNDILSDLESDHTGAVLIYGHDFTSLSKEFNDLDLDNLKLTPLSDWDWWALTCDLSIFDKKTNLDDLSNNKFDFNHQSSNLSNIVDQDLSLNSMTDNVSNNSLSSTIDTVQTASTSTFDSGSF